MGRKKRSKKNSRAPHPSQMVAPTTSNITHSVHFIPPLVRKLMRSYMSHAIPDVESMAPPAITRCFLAKFSRVSINFRDTSMDVAQEYLSKCNVPLSPNHRLFRYLTRQHNMYLPIISFDESFFFEPFPRVEGISIENSIDQTFYLLRSDDFLFPKLRSISLKFSHDPPESSFSVSPCLVRNIRSLKISTVRSYNENLVNLVDTFVHVTDLELNLQEDRIKACDFSKFWKLTRLKLDCRELPYRFEISVTGLEKMAFLQELDLNLNGSQLQEFPNLHDDCYLETLSLILPNLRCFQQMKLETFNSVSKFSVTALQFVSAHLPHVQKGVQKITELNIIGNFEVPMFFCEYMFSIKHFSMAHCNEMRSIDLTNMPTLESLEVSSCRRLQSLKGAGKTFLRLWKVVIEQCPSLQLSNLKFLEFVTTLTAPMNILKKAPSANVTTLTISKLGESIKGLPLFPRVKTLVLDVTEGYSEKFVKLFKNLDPSDLKDRVPRCKFFSFGFANPNLPDMSDIFGQMSVYEGV
ncbi:hypothetical protein P9112_010805 [Eukaryota sp. TZLM1-RC]